jgi:hypothetical protein
MKATIDTNAQLVTLRSIVERHQWAYVTFDGEPSTVRVDAFTANAMTQVYDALTEEQRPRIDELMTTYEGFERVIAFVWKVLSK